MVLLSDVSARRQLVAHRLTSPPSVQQATCCGHPPTKQIQAPHDTIIPDNEGSHGAEYHHLQGRSDNSPKPLFEPAGI